MASLAARARNWPLVQQAIDLAAGYNRVFPDLDAARKVAAQYGLPGADSAEAASALQARLATTRPSDYPVLFHRSRLPLDGLCVFDLGGAMGNIFFLYHRYLAFPPSLRWTVHDLPGNMDRGREFARQRGETRLQFTDDPRGASGYDVLLVSGALHYFDFTLADYVAGLSDRPRHVLVNRTPLVDAPTAATVQHTPGVVMVPCRLLNRAELVAGMEKLGYRLLDSCAPPSCRSNCRTTQSTGSGSTAGPIFGLTGERGPRRIHCGLARDGFFTVHVGRPIVRPGGVR